MINNMLNNQSTTQPLPTDYAPAERSDRDTLMRQHDTWMQQEQTRLLGDAVPNVVLVLNNTRQIVYANSHVTLFGNYTEVNSYLGLRPGELMNCTRAFISEGGCGTTKYCRDCGAVNAILTSLIGKKDAEECLIDRSGNRKPLELRVLTTPVKLAGEDFVIFSIEDIHVEKENERLLEEVQRLAIIDPLTGVPNRRAFFENASREFLRMVRYHRSMVILMFDADKFKATNDTLGHLAGDSILRAIALGIRANLREPDIFARYGGDEFIALLPETELKMGTSVAKRIVEAVSLLEVEIDGKVIHPSITVGVAAFDPVDLSLESLIARADADLLRKKQQRR
jgi:diguanylate cyclase (GGDEF)-like protein